MTHPKITLPHRAANIFWVSLRALILLLTLPLLLVTYLVKLLAEWAEHLEDFISDFVRSITATFSPKIFNALNEALKENKRLEEHNKFLKTQYEYWEKRANEIDEADFESDPNLNGYKVCVEPAVLSKTVEESEPISELEKEALEKEFRELGVCSISSSSGLTYENLRDHKQAFKNLIEHDIKLIKEFDKNN